MDELKPSEVLKCMQLCGNALTCTTDDHECAYGDEGCMDCVDRLDADIQTLVDAGDDLIIRRPAPENASKVVKNLWALYDKYEDAEHVVCGEAANLLTAAPENKPLTVFGALTKSPEVFDEFIRKVNLGQILIDELFCNGDCGNDDCPHELQCIINWLNGPYAHKPEQEEKPL